MVGTPFGSSAKTTVSKGEKQLEEVLSLAVINSNKGKDLYDRSLYEQAIEQYDRAIHLDPDFADAYNHRAYAYYHDVGPEQRAIRDIDKPSS